MRAECDAGSLCDIVANTRTLASRMSKHYNLLISHLDNYKAHTCIFKKSESYLEYLHDFVLCYKFYHKIVQ